jgi:hypothetical protein
MNIHSELDTFQFINDEPNFEINLEQQFQIQDFANKLNEESINKDKLSIYVKLCIIYLTEFEKFYIILNDVNIINNLEKLYEIIHVDIKISKFEIKTFDHIKYDFINFLNKNFLYKEYPTNSTSINEIQEIIINDINNINNFFVIQNKYSFSILLCDDENKKSSLIKKAIADDNKLNLKNDSYPPKITIYNNEINDEVISEDSKYYSIKNEWIEQNKVEELEKIFKKIIFVAPESSRNSIFNNPLIDLDPEFLFDELNQDVKTQVEINKAKYTETPEKHYQQLLLIDDCTSHLKTNSNIKMLNDLVYNRRHNSLCIILLTQYITSIPASVRSQYNSIVLFKPSKKDYERINKEFLFMKKMNL